MASNRGSVRPYVYSGDVNDPGPHRRSSVRYSTVVVDPPWSYDSWPDESTSPKAASKSFRVAAPGVRAKRRPIAYPTMTVAEITSLVIPATTNAHLYLWTTNRYLRDAYAVVDAWGFRFGQLLVWCKEPRGIGPGGAFAQNAEFVLFCRKGSPGQLRRLDSVWYRWPRSNTHSRKPEAFLDLVETVSPGPYLEMFARRNRLGWDTWGNEALEHVEMASGI